MKKLLLLLLLSAYGTMAQNPNNVEMADTFRENGKIYVVVGVIVIIFIGLFVYLITVDRKVSRLEKKMEE
ncbi:MAG: CcmD family protein [Flavobacteriales bacterium]|nr:CcmD family protein [Flavobacteriales bacterium]